MRHAWPYILITVFAVAQLCYSAPGDKVAYTTKPQHDRLSSATQGKLNGKLDKTTFGAYTSKTNRAIYDLQSSSVQPDNVTCFINMSGKLYCPGSGGAIPLANYSTNGLMSKEDKYDFDNDRVKGSIRLSHTTAKPSNPSVGDTRVLPFTLRQFYGNPVIKGSQNGIDRDSSSNSDPAVYKTPGGKYYALYVGTEDGYITGASPDLPEAKGAQMVRVSENINGPWRRYGRIDTAFTNYSDHYYKRHAADAEIKYSSGTWHVWGSTWPLPVAYESGGSVAGSESRRVISHWTATNGDPEVFPLTGWSSPGPAVQDTAAGATVKTTATGANTGLSIPVASSAGFVVGDIIVNERTRLASIIGAIPDATHITVDYAFTVINSDPIYAYETSNYYGPQIVDKDGGGYIMFMNAYPYSEHGVRYSTASSLDGPWTAPTIVDGMYENGIWWEQTNYFTTEEKHYQIVQIPRTWNGSAWVGRNTVAIYEADTQIGPYTEIVYDIMGIAYGRSPWNSKAYRTSDLVTHDLDSETLEGLIDGWHNNGVDEPPYDATEDYVSIGAFTLSKEPTILTWNGTEWVRDKQYSYVSVTAPDSHIVTEWLAPDTSNVMSIFDSYGDASRFITRRANGTEEGPSAVLSGQTIGAIGFRGHDGDNFSTSSVASITGVAEENYTTTQQGTTLNLYYTPMGGIATLAGLSLDAITSRVVVSAPNGLEFPDGTTQGTSAKSSGASGRVQISNGAEGFTSSANAKISGADTGTLTITDLLWTGNLQQTFVKNSLTATDTDKPPSANALKTVSDRIPVMTVGSIPFSNGTIFTQDNANFFWNDTDNRLGIGTAAPANSLHVVNTAAAAAGRFVRSGTATNTIVPVMAINHTTTADMVDGFGASIIFQATDSGASDQLLGQIGAVRDGADNSGAIVLRPSVAGTGTEKMRIASSGLITYPNSSGTPYGSFYMDDGSTAVSATSANVYYGVQSGMTTGLVNFMTFQNSRELVCTTAGKYKVDWSISLISSSSDQTVSGAILVDSTEAHQCENSTRAKENGVVYSVGSACMVSCAANSIIKLAIQNETSAGTTITVSHAGLVAEYKSSL